MQKKLLTPSPSIYAEHADLEKQLIHTHSFELEGELCKKISKLESTYNFDPYIFEEGNLCGIKGALGNVIVPAKYQDFKFTTPYRLKRETCVVTKNNDKWGIVSTDGNATILVPFIYDDMTWFVCPVVGVKKEGKYGYIRPDGNLITPIEYDGIQFFDKGIFWRGAPSYSRFERDGKYGVIDYDGNYTPAHFDEIIVEDTDGALKARIGDQIAYITKEGNLDIDECDAWYVYQEI